MHLLHVLGLAYNSTATVTYSIEVKKCNDVAIANEISSINWNNAFG